LSRVYRKEETMKKGGGGKKPIPRFDQKFKVEIPEGKKKAKESFERN